MSVNNDLPLMDYEGLLTPIVEENHEQLMNSTAKIRSKQRLNFIDDTSITPQIQVHRDIFPFNQPHESTDKQGAHDNKEAIIKRLREEYAFNLGQYRAIARVAAKRKS